MMLPAFLDLFFPPHPTLIPFTLGELWAGSEGMECEDCKKATWTVWLSNEEYASLPNNNRPEAALKICNDKLGLILCYECGVKHV